MISPWTTNQSLTLEEQLDQGIAWFDMRITYSIEDGQLYISHTMMTTMTLSAALTIMSNYLASYPRPLLLHLRVDYAARSNAGIIQSVMSHLLDYHASMIISRKNITSTIESLPSGLLIYCADGTLQHPLIISADLMPTVSFWDAGSIEECERRIQNLEEEYEKQKNGPFLFPSQRMLLFDYSSNLPLCITDYQQNKIIETYHDAIVSSKPTILAGNYIQWFLSHF